MIATFFLIFAFLRSIRWSRRRAPPLSNNDDHEKSLIESKDKLSSLGQSMFSRSDSSATTTSSSGVGNVASGSYIGGKKRGDSTASTISTSVFSETVQDGRRSSDGVRATSSQHNLHQQQNRRSSGRIRRFPGSRTTIAGARRRTTGRFALYTYKYINYFRPFHLAVETQLKKNIYSVIFIILTISCKLIML